MDRAHATRDHLLAVASELFHRNGFDGTSFDEIVRISGVRRGNIYYYFKTKDEILEAVVARRMEEARATIERWCADADAPRERLARFVEMISSRGAELARHGCPIGTLTSELGKGNGERKAIARPLFDVYRSFAADQIRAIGYPPTRARALAMELLAAAQGAAVLAHAYGDPVLLRGLIATLRARIDEIAASSPEGHAKRRVGANRSRKAK